MATRGRGLSRQRIDKKRSVIQCQLHRGINTATANSGVRARKFGEDDDDVDGARLSARETEGGWDPGVSRLLGASASERGREGTRVGLVGCFLSWARILVLSLFYFLSLFLFLN